MSRSLSPYNGGGLALFHTVHRNLGPDGPSAFTNGLCGSLLVDVGVDVGRFWVAEGRAGRGQVKNAAFPKLFSKNEDSIKENRVWKIVCGKMYTVLPHLLHQHQILHKYISYW
jgi:hypothetical protein